MMHCFGTRSNVGFSEVDTRDVVATLVQPVDMGVTHCNQKWADSCKEESCQYCALLAAYEQKNVIIIIIDDNALSVQGRQLRPIRQPMFRI